MRLLPFLLAAGLAGPAALRADDTPPDTLITCTGPADVSSTDTETTARFHDQVVVTGNGIRLTCDFLQVVSLRKGDRTATLGEYGNFKSLVATGHVYIHQGDREATCGRAEAFPVRNVIVLSENPLVRYLKDQSTITGARITLYRGERRAVVESDATHTPTATLPPLKDLGFDKPSDTAPAPSTPPAAARERPASSIETTGLTKAFGAKRVVDGVGLHFGAGEVVGLLGPNGAGKTTTFYMIVGLLPATGGRVLLEGRDITRLRMHERARHGIGYLPQEPSVFRKLTVEENILAIAEAIGLPKKERAARVERHLTELGLTEVARQKAYTLSGGERRRLEIARMLVTRPKFLLMDEPFAAIDPISVAEVQKIILDLRRRGIGIVVTDHNVRETLRIVDRAYLIHQGQVLTEGSAEFLIQDEQARKFYLGEDFNL